MFGAQSAFGLVLCVLLRIGSDAYAQGINIEISSDALLIAEILGSDNHRIEFCYVQAITITGGQIEGIIIRCKDKTMDIDPGHYQIILSRQGAAIRIACTGQQMSEILGLK